MRPLPLLVVLAACHRHDAADRGHDTGHTDGVDTVVVDTEPVDTVVVDTVVVDTEPVDTDGCPDPTPPFAGSEPFPWLVPTTPLLRADGRLVVLLLSPEADGTDGVRAALRVWSPDDLAWSTVEVASAEELGLVDGIRHGVVEHDGRLSIVLVTTGEDAGGVVVLDEQVDGTFSDPAEVATAAPVATTAPVVLLARNGALALFHSFETGSTPARRVAVTERAAGSATWTASKLVDHFAPTATTAVAGRFANAGYLRIIVQDTQGQWLALRREDKDWLQDDALALDPGILSSALADGTASRRDADEGVLIGWAGGDTEDELATRAVFFGGAPATFHDVDLVGAYGTPSLAVTAAGDGVLTSTPTTGSLSAATVTAGHVAASDVVRPELHARSTALAFTDACGVPSALVALTAAASGTVVGDDWRIVPLAP